MDARPTPDADTLRAYGWDALLAERFAPFAEQGYLPGRVVVEYQHIYRIVLADGEMLATVAGRLRHRAEGRRDYPAVGDWIAARLTPDGERATLHGVVPRKSQFVRKVAGSVVAEQVVAANVDVVLLVMALDADFNPRRLERYLILARESGARPVIVLSKADLCGADTLAEKIEIARSAAGEDVPIHAVSAPRDEGYDALAAYLQAGKTVTLLGSSGVGKSTIVNRLAGEDVQHTQEVRVSDGRGRHTTTHRQVILLPDGGLLMDTPGMRELQLWDVDEGVEATFADVEALGAECRFPDCQHAREPDCAVQDAIQQGRLPAGRLESFHKLRRELRALTARQDHLNRQFERRRVRAVTKAFNRHNPRG
ncbi:MAG: ribosome small subunit-dependent GTPase A [Chloroflexi bacterium]|nr:ribosome small subunit-dependent GTPase A [Chloroflexota bacterium]